MLTPIKRSRFIAGALLCGTPALFTPAQAQEAGYPEQQAQDAGQPEQAALGSFATTNPNLNDWNLIKLTASDAGAALDGAGVKVAVLDGKADCRASQLVGRCQFIPLPGATYSTLDTHGTHVSGIVGANPFGVAPAATVLNYGVYGDGGYVASGGLSATWTSAYAAGAQIASMSFACTRKALCLSAYDINTMASPGLPMLFVKAAGNHGADLYTETTAVTYSAAVAALNKTLIVGSVNAAGTISSFSNRPGSGCLLPQGTTTCSAELSWMNHFLVAPGEAIYSTMPNGQLGYMSGTSMATPVVAGVAALLQARWPFLKNSPDVLARILLTSATDLGAPGVDPVYGYGLLNASAAFLASGSVTIVPVTITTPTTTTSPTTETSTRPAKGRSKKSSVGGGSFAGLGPVLGGVTVFDQFGRDFRWDETGTLAVNAAPDPRQMSSRRLLGAFTQDSWASALFSPERAARSFMAYGSVTDIPGLTVEEAPSLRAGVDVPFGAAALQVRLTGAANPRADLAYDPELRALAFFPSTDLATGSLISNMLLPLGERSRLMVYGIKSTGTVEAATELPGTAMMPDRRITALNRRRQLGDVDTVRDEHAGIGVSYWQQGGSGLVWGANFSAMRQKNAFYDTTINIAGFDKPTNLVNFGLAASQARGGWDLSASAEVTHLRMKMGGQAIGFTPTTLVSGELAVARSGVFVRNSAANDSLRIAVSLPPRAVAGNLRLDFMSRSADGMELEPATRRIRVAELGHEPARLEAAYRVGSASRWSLELSGGLALERSNKRRSATEGLITFRTSL